MLDLAIGVIIERLGFKYHQISLMRIHLLHEITISLREVARKRVYLALNKLNTLLELLLGSHKISLRKRVYVFRATCNEEAGNEESLCVNDAGSWKALRTRQGSADAYCRRKY
jgi:hypothetical protein